MTLHEIHNSKTTVTNVTVFWHAIPRNFAEACLSAELRDVTSQKQHNVHIYCHENLQTRVIFYYYVTVHSYWVL
jgi:hypothetical protein